MKLFSMKLFFQRFILPSKNLSQIEDWVNYLTEKQMFVESHWHCCNLVNKSWQRERERTPAISTLFQYSSIPHLQNSVFNKHWEYFKISNSSILTRSIKIHTLQFSLNVFEIDPFFYVFMSYNKYHLCFQYVCVMNIICLISIIKYGRSLMHLVKSSNEVWTFRDMYRWVTKRVEWIPLNKKWSLKMYALR